MAMKTNALDSRFDTRPVAGRARTLHHIASVLALALCLLTATAAIAADTTNLTTLLQQGLFEEEANRNLEAAIASYETLAKQFDKDRQIAATAVYRLGECYRKLGRIDDATAQFQKIIREFPEQQTLVMLSGQNLSVLAPGTGISPAAFEAYTVAAGDTLSSIVARYRNSGRSFSAADILAANPNLNPNRLQIGQQIKIPIPGGAPGSEAPNEVRLLKAHLNALEKLPPAEARLYVQHNFSNPVLDKLLQDLVEAEQQLVKMRAAYSPEHPSYRNAVQVAETIAKQIDNQVNITVQSLKTSIAASENKTEDSESPVVTDEEQQEIRRVEVMLQNSPDLINAPIPGPNGYTPLLQAANKGQLRVAQFLLEHGANLNSRLPNGDTPLILAATSGHKAMVELLLKHGAEPDTRGWKGYTALHAAASRGFKAVAEVLLEHKADANARASGDQGDQSTPLHGAAVNGRTSMIEFLLAHGAELSALNYLGKTPLHLAAEQGQLDAVKTLLNAKAEINARAKDGATPLMNAVIARRHDAAVALIAAGADPNLSLEDGTWKGATPLHFAVAANDEGLVREMLKHGANPNVSASARPINSSGSSSMQSADSGPPLLTALQQNQPAIAELLLEHGADPNVTWKSGYPALVSIDDKMLKVLLDHGADPRRSAPGGQTALHLLANNGGSTNQAALLVQHGADVNATNQAGRTPLHLAVGSGHLEMAALLLELNANPNKRDNEGNTPLDLTKSPARMSGFAPGPRPIGPAAPNNSPGLAALLRRHGASDELPHFDRIDVRRPSTDFLGTAFSRTTNDWNEFRLMELLARQYQLIDTAPAGTWQEVRSFRSQLWNKNPCRFPDLQRISIRRPAGNTNWSVINVDAAQLLSSGGRSNDVWLQWGDVVEIPESDHPVNQEWAGLDNQTLDSLIQSVSRKISVVVKDSSKPVEAGPSCLFPGGGLSRPDSGTDPSVRITRASFMIRSFLDNSGLILASSDLSKVKVTRADSATGEKEQWILDCSGNKAPEFWLRNGDVIEVPER